MKHGDFYCENIHMCKNNNKTKTQWFSKTGAFFLCFLYVQDRCFFFLFIYSRLFTEVVHSRFCLASGKEAPVAVNLIPLMPFSSPEPEEPEDEEGWETVQRGGRLKSRQSPSQKSLENLSEVGMGGKKQLTRSMSVPDSTAAAPKDKWGQSNANNHRGGRNDNKSMRAISEQHLPDTRERLDSKGSEKENIPRVPKSASGLAGGSSRDPQIEKVKRDIFGSKKSNGAWEKKEPEPGQKMVREKRPQQEEKKEAETSEAKSSDDENLDSQLNNVRFRLCLLIIMVALVVLVVALLVVPSGVGGSNAGGCGCSWTL